jgi:hypothetical protein
MSNRLVHLRLTRGLILVLSITLGLLLVSCGAPSERPSTETRGTWVGRPIGSAPQPNPGLKRAMIQRATREWEHFDRQVVVYKGPDESIPRVGAWEDDYTHASRVNLYWRAVNKPALDGMDCRQPWSAAFISWVMQSAGVPTSQFSPTSAHRVYLSRMIEDAHYPGRYFVPRRIQDYSPRPGDLVCASRGRTPVRPVDGYTSPWMLQGAETHCDLVVAKSGRTLEVIGGNVRNSVSKSVLELDDRGRMKPVPKRAWFLIMENRL